MIRLVAAALKHPANRTLGEFHRYWADCHGPLRARDEAVRRYVLHLTLDEAYGDEPAPSFDGASAAWFDDLGALVAHATRPASPALWTTIVADDAQLFDRAESWPTDHRSATIVGTETVILDGSTAPGMVKANGNRQIVIAKVTKSKTPMGGVAVRFTGIGLNKVVKTNKQGVARIGITPSKAGIMLVRITNVKACNSARIGVVGVFEPPVTG